MENSSLLRPIVFKPVAPVRDIQGSRNTLIEDAPQISVRRALPQQLQSWCHLISPLSEDVPTPRALGYSQSVGSSPHHSSSESEADEPSLWSKRSSASFDELYDITESESEQVPIKLSSSVKRHVAKKGLKSRYPSIVIPPPAHWPSIDKMKSTSALSPPLNINLSPSILAQLQHRVLRVPSTSSAPSLDGSQTSEELAASSCPSTPDVSRANTSETLWEPPIQLDQTSINLLRHIHPGDEQEHLDTVLEIPLEAPAEMEMAVESPPITECFRIDTSSPTPCAEDADDELSALSVPSPGGFFASLDSTMARKAWAGTEPTPTTSTATEFYNVPFESAEGSSLSTSTAASFYNLPWGIRPDNAVEHVISLSSPTSTQDPVTARKTVFSPTDVVDEVDEIDETYDSALKQSAAANIDRTALWLSAQDAYMIAICEEDDVAASFSDVPDILPKTPENASPTSADFDSPGKKSVRFADESPQVLSSSAEQRRISPIHDGTFWEAWRHNKRSQRARDVFRHRQARAEADQVHRISLRKAHTAQLQGKFEITRAKRPSPQRPISSFLPAAAEDERKELIATAERERGALEQIQSSSWHIAAQKEVNGGKLLTSPIVSSFRVRQDVRVLDLAGQAHCGWAWSIACEHPKATVFTTVSSDAEAHVLSSSLEGPSNHHVTASPKLWELPFDSDYFDVISARNLFMHLRTLWPKGSAADEWDLTLRECLRVLKPGGYLEFALLDAELVHADATSLALGVEFAFNLKTRGYEPCPGKTFLPRLKRAGFCEIKRAWMVLPVADVVPRWEDAEKSQQSNPTERCIDTDGTLSEFKPPVTGSTKDIRAVSGLVGARMWEQWMLKLSNEMDRSERRVMEEVSKALEDAGKANSGWRSLVGWARKEL